MGATADRGECDGFERRVERHFGPLLARHGFALAGRALAGSGQHLSCQLLYASGGCLVLFESGDGAEACALGATGTPPPPVGILHHLDGRDGWYEVGELVEFSTGRRLLSPRLLERMRDGRLDQLAWLAGVLGERAEALFGLFQPGRPPAWHERFLGYQLTKRPYGREPLGARLRRWLPG
jgi:hypothetical protein